MKRFLLILALVLVAVPVLADHLHFDPVDERPFMDCSYNATRAAGCLSGNFSVNDTEMDSTDFITSNSWCNNSRGYYTFNGTDSISYDNVSSLYNITNISIVVGFTGTNVSRFGGIVSLFNEDLGGTGWSIRTMNTSFLNFRSVNATDDVSYNLDEQNHTWLNNNTNYTLVITFDGEFLRAWLNNVQIEKQTFTGPLVANSSSKLRLGYYNSTSTNRFLGQIHFVYIYNYTLTPQQVVNRTTVICGSQLHAFNTTRFGIWPTSNNSLPNWTNISGPDRLHDPYNFRTFSDHANNLDFHRGVDFLNVTNISILAVMNGTVVQVENDTESNASGGRARFGNWVLIEHNPDPDTGMPRHTAYLHMNSTPLVVTGQNVTQGEIIGYTGKSGENIRDEHLHIELARDLNEDNYANRSAIHTLRIFNYTDVNATSINVVANSTDYIAHVQHNFSDMDLVAIKFVGAWQNRTVDYETKQGLNISNADQSCVNDVCFFPQNVTFPFTNYSVNYSINRLVSGPLAGVVIRDINNNVQIYDITSWPNPNITLTKNATPITVNTSDFINYTITLNVTGDAAFNVTVSETYPASVRFHNSSPVAVGANDTFLIGNLSVGIYRINITAQALNVSNGTLANNNANVTYFNLTGTEFRMNTSANATILNELVFANLSVFKNVSASTIATDAFFTYTIRLNVTNGSTFNVTVSDNYPSGITFRNATPSPSASSNETFIIGNLTAGSIYQLNITAQVNNISDSTVSNTANASFANSTGGVFSSNSSISFTADAPDTSPSPSGGSSGGGGGGGTTSKPTKSCTPNWFCSDWTTCTGTQERECLDLQGCGSKYLKPEDIRTCKIEVKETPAKVIEPFTPTIRARKVFYVSKLLVIMSLLVLGVVISHSHFLLKLKRDPVRAYVTHARAHGASDRTIRTQLKKAGWKEYAIDEEMKK